jgi:hypothetical protein
MARVSKEKKAEALANLRKMLPPGTRIYVSNVHTSRSGMMRTLKLYKAEGGSIRWISCYWVAAAIGWSVDEQREGVKVSGCGMDMGFHLVNTLSYALHGMKDHGDGAKPENAGRPFQPRRGHYRAGYSLTHEWL